MDINKEIVLAVEHYKAGNLQQAEYILREILNVQPDNVHVLHFIGAICYQLDNYDASIEYIKKALQIIPTNAEAYYTMGNAFRKKWQLDEAITCYQKALQFNPGSYEAHHNLGIVLMEKKQIDEAILSFRNALQLNPNLHDAHYTLGIAFQEKGQHDEAIKHYQQAIQLNPNDYEAYDNLGTAFQDTGQFDEAIICYQKAIELNPNLYDAYNNMGIVFQEKGESGEAIKYFQQALQLNPNFAKTYNNIGIALHSQGQLDEALRFYEKALLLNPDYADAHLNISHALLLLGNFSRGWREYEWRWETRVLLAKKRNIPLPSWDGSSLKGKTLWIYTEQGIGDEIMFASCLPEVIEQAQLCIVECEKRLVPLFTRSFPKAMVIEPLSTIDWHNANLPPSDLKVAIASLPLFLRPSLSSFPQPEAYLATDTQKVQEWRNLLAALGEGLKVGISWRGGNRPSIIRTRSTTLTQWAKLFAIPGIHFINLQYGNCVADLQDARRNLGVTIHDWEDADPLKDLDGFAAKIAALDLVISVDNSTVHMAGALGIPVWTLLPFACDWRWMREFDDTPWYSTMRLFRQNSPGDWEEVFEQLYDALRKTIETRYIFSNNSSSSVKISYKSLLDNKLLNVNEKVCLENNNETKTINKLNTLSDREIAEKEKEKYLTAWTMDNRVYAAYSPGFELSHTINFLDFFKNKDVKTILDAGIGSGKLCKKMISMGFDCHGLDIADNCLDEDLSQLKDKILTVGTLWDRILFEENRFNAIVCTDVLEHIPTHYIQSVLDNFYRWSNRFLFLQIALFDDNFGKRIGQPLHLTVKPKSWWDERMIKFKLIQNIVLKNESGVDAYAVYLLEKLPNDKTDDSIDTPSS
jgi:tetratricopeptide (TPR) repeat protein/2-polyprenyl-3-methyl-5-hydroxy-6-metoxy-1,4-benzoquinol methylase